nr:hypothetical protein Iba_chr05fCG6590 [Ipomoea batatas]
MTRIKIEDTDPTKESRGPRQVTPDEATIYPSRVAGLGAWLPLPLPGECHSVSQSISGAGVMIHYDDALFPTISL